MSQFEQFRGRMFAPKALAKELSTTPLTLARMEKQGKIHAVKLSSHCKRYIGDSVADYLAGCAAATSA